METVPCMEAPAWTTEIPALCSCPFTQSWYIKSISAKEVEAHNFAGDTFSVIAWYASSSDSSSSKYSPKVIFWGHKAQSKNNLKKKSVFVRASIPACGHGFSHWNVCPCNSNKTFWLDEKHCSIVSLFFSFKYRSTLHRLTIPPHLVDAVVEAYKNQNGELFFLFLFPFLTASVHDLRTPIRFLQTSWKKSWKNWNSDGTWLDRSVCKYVYLCVWVHT